MSIHEFLKTHSLTQLDKALKTQEMVLVRKGRRLMVEPPKPGSLPRPNGVYVPPARPNMRPLEQRTPSLADFE